MKRPVVIFVGLCGLLTDIGCMQIIMTSFTWFGRGDPARLDPGVWALCSFVLYFADRLQLRKTARLPVLVTVNAVIFGLSLAALLAVSPALPGFFAVFASVVFMIITTVEAFRFSVAPRNLNAQILFFDVYLLCMGWYVLSVEGGLSGTDFPFLLVVLVLNMVCNIALRAAEENVGLTLTASPVSGTLFSAGLFAALTGGAVLLVKLFAPASRSLADTLIAATGAGLSFVFGMLNRFFTWLFSLLPYHESDGDFLPEPETGAQFEDMPELVEFRPEVFYAIIIAAAALVAILLIYIVLRFRKMKISASGAPVKKARPARFAKVSARLKKRIGPFFAGLLFAFKSLRFINTPPGTLVRLEHWGKKHDKSRAPGQSMREYLLTLSSGLTPIADDLDAIYFGGRTGVLSKTRCRELRREFFIKNKNKGKRR